MNHRDSGNQEAQIGETYRQDARTCSHDGASEIHIAPLVRAQLKTTRNAETSSDI